MKRLTILVATLSFVALGSVALAAQGTPAGHTKDCPCPQQCATTGPGLTPLELVR